MSDQRTLNDDWQSSQTPQNPRAYVMRKRHGNGPEGATCNDCAYLVRVKHGTRCYYKCELRGITSGAATDHRCGWAACGQYRKEEASK